MENDHINGLNKSISKYRNPMQWNLLFVELYLRQNLFAQMSLNHRCVANIVLFTAKRMAQVK